MCCREDGRALDWCMYEGQFQKIAKGATLGGE